MRYLYIGAGFLCFGLGAAGAVLPVLPTAPFLLAAAYCFARGSQRFHHWLLSTRLYRKCLKDYVKTGSMKRKTKVIIVAYASAMLLLAFLAAKALPVRILLLLAAALLYYWFVFRIKTRRS